MKPSNFPRAGQDSNATRVNGKIRAREVLLIDETGQKIGVMSSRDALERAEQAGLDLVEIAPNSNPPVCRIMDYGKYKYQQQKKNSKKSQKTTELKELKFRPHIETHDYNVKMKQAHKFLDAGNKVKFTLRFRGREMAHKELGMDVLKRIRVELEDKVKVEAEPKLEGRQMVMVVTPVSQK